MAKAQDYLAEYEKQFAQYSAAIEAGNLNGQMPTFDADRYRTLLTEEFQLEQQAVLEAFKKTQTEEQAKFEQQRAEMARQQERLAAEAAAAEEQARKNLAQSQADAAAAAKEREVKTTQLREETETAQRGVGARRAGYVRARRMRSRSLLSGL